MTYLWDLNIQTIPCSWEQEYLFAKETTPDGTKVSFLFYSSQQQKSLNLTQREKEYWYDPVGFYQKIYEYFSFYQNKAKDLLENQRYLTDKEFVYQMLKIDMALYGLLYVWTLEEWDPSVFDPKFADGFCKDSHLYLHEKEIPDELKKIEQFKFIHSLRQ